MITTISSWRCKCGVNIKVVGETEREKPLATSMAECPDCHDNQLIYSGRILSISVERNTKSEASNRQAE